jgi:hypothetical protein
MLTEKRTNSSFCFINQAHHDILSMQKNSDVCKNANYNKFNEDRCSVKDETFLKQHKKCYHPYTHTYISTECSWSTLKHSKGKVQCIKATEQVYIMRFPKGLRFRYCNSFKTIYWERVQRHRIIYDGVYGTRKHQSHFSRTAGKLSTCERLFLVL